MSVQLTWANIVVIGSVFHVACFGQFNNAGDGNVPPVIAAISRLLLRDSTELPMNVAVTRVIEDVGGREKRRSQTSTQLIFHGYNPQSGPA